MSETVMSVIANTLQHKNYNAEAIERKAIEDVDEGLKVGGQLLQTIMFADDQEVVADTERGLQRMMDKMNESVERHGMKINGKKTKEMKIGRNPIVQYTLH